jgi:peptide-methionine (R)-S-oxide reductase
MIRAGCFLTNLNGPPRFCPNPLRAGWRSVRKRLFNQPNYLVPMKSFLPFLLLVLVLAGAFLLTNMRSASRPIAEDPLPPGGRRVTKTNAEWKKILTSDQYSVLRDHGTERPFTSPLNDIHEAGTFVCAACKNPLFASGTKFDSGTGWPSFYQPIVKNAVREAKDTSYGTVRVEVLCNVCGGHLGHVFEDGPKPTGLRYCMNGVAMAFVKK